MVQLNIFTEVAALKRLPLPAMLLALGLSTSAFTTQAQTSPQPPQPAEIPAPPTVSTKTADDFEPTVTIRKEKGQQIEEFRIRGKLYMIRVTPANGKPYILKDKDGSGHFEAGETYGSGMSVPMWVIGEF